MRCHLLRSARQVAAEIQRYCAKHPDARDTLEGIAWWVHMQREEDMRDSVAEAVRLLVKEGKLERHRLQDGSEVFGAGRHAIRRDIV